MNRLKLVRHNLRYFWKTNAALFLGLMAGTAVITGALIVGDSVRQSLVQTSLARLGEVDLTLHTPRFFRQDLAQQLSGPSEENDAPIQTAPLISLNSSLVYEEENDAQGTNNIHRANNTNLFGIGAEGWSMLENSDVTPPNANEILINARLAGELNVKVGDELSAWIELPSTIPRDSLLGERDETSIELRYVIREIIPEQVGAGRFAFTPNQQLPRTCFVNLSTLQDSLDLSAIKPTRRNPEERFARVNSLLTTGFYGDEEPSGIKDVQVQNSLLQMQNQLDKQVNLSDLYLKFRQNEEQGYLTLESEQMILEEPVATAIQTVAKELDLPTSPILVYLANEISSGSNPDNFSMYSIVAGIDLSENAPFGPFEFASEKAPTELGENEIILNEWLATDLAVTVGDLINLSYHTVGSHGELPEESRTFTVTGICKMTGPAADRGLTPDLKGITDAERFSDWDQPFPMEMDRITDRDDEYWEQYRATPKAFVSLETAQALWKSRYGQLTSYRIAPTSSETNIANLEKSVSSKFLTQMKPAQLGLQFQPTRATGLAAAQGTNDFSQLFLAFSFFIILAALVLVSLLFKLSLERRASEVGLLMAVGYQDYHVRRQFLLEGFLLTLVGTIGGAILAVAYAALMMYGLKTWWNQAVGTADLNLYVNPFSLVSGMIVTASLALVVIWRSLAILNRRSPNALLSGRLETESNQVKRAPKVARWVCIFLGGLGGVLLLAGLLGLLPQQEAFSGFSWRVVSFFLVGFSLLIAFIAAFQVWLKKPDLAELKGAGTNGLARLSIKNVMRHPQRSLLTVLLMSLATFIIVAVAAGRRNPTSEQPELHSGNGGFTLLAESSLPLVYNLNNPEGQAKLFLDSTQTEQLQGIKTYSFRVQPGEEASCLNLYQTRLPTILGVPDEFIQRGGFKFADTPGENPWQTLTKKQGEAIPVIGDMNTLQYSLHVALGDEIDMTDQRGINHPLKIAGMLDGSVFQGVLLMSEKHFRELFPERAGYQYFLFEAPLDNMPELTKVLETQLTEYGFDAEPVSERIAQFLAVQNTYLSTFQTLGGLGLLLGSFGLGTVMLRNVLERNSELALLRAVGVTPAGIGWMVLVENGFLLSCGLLSGVIAALLAMAPHLMSTGADFLWLSTIIILGLIWIVGMLAALFAVYAAVKTPIVSSLRAL
ncbi:FtsX-like permease family protein [Polystyrenella longa]|uniref:FtsX-like permease family protein n=1 Tax=Polystyrenella longa TaxID=2528007 RepID=A0A518CP94_9PLAN|nr:FtsX-like permease family protein [Polystyrenella longa]QDU81038.1 FtsX-like permease family protein [Polystyrenella longa]